LPRDVGVVLVAAGQGRRLGGSPKQYRDLAGVPMLLRALRPFTSHPEVEHLVVVLPPADLATPPDWLAGLVGGSLSLASGGAERSDSVAHGLAGLPGHCRTVLVHDAARPLVDRATIDAVIAVARTGVGAVPAVPLGDTLKEVARDDPGLAVLRTVPRDRLWRAQTPQGFPRALLEEAHARARHEDQTGTDDAVLIERLGSPVRLVPGSPLNFKVTGEEDLQLAELVLRSGLSGER
jgi:2-C-methyl-D-erythritol 4-phosphate cytidylyltransferase